MDDRLKSLRDDIEAVQRELQQAVSGLTEAQLDHPTTNEGWSARDVLAHLSSIDARMRQRWQAVVDGTDWAGESEPVDVYNARCVAERRTWSTRQIVDEFQQSVRETLAFVDRLQPDDLDRTYNHPRRGQVSLESQIRHAPEHLREHLQEVQAAADR